MSNVTVKSRVERGLCAGCCAPNSRSTQLCERCSKETQRKRKRKLAEARSGGMCSRCGVRPPDTDYKTCARCRKQRAKEAAKRRVKKIAAGICSSCQQCEVGRDGVVCQRCLDKMNNRRRALIERGVCTYCAKRKADTGTYCRTCKDSKANARYRQKQQVVDHYGGACACCGDTFIWRLTIDHIDDDGADHRRDEGVKAGGSTYRWLIREDYPMGFQVLCFSCNSAKHYGHGCPHGPEVYMDLKLKPKATAHIVAPRPEVA